RGERRGFAVRGAGAWCRPRGRGEDEDGPSALHRSGDRGAGRGARRRPDRGRLVAAVASPVALLLADGRIRAQEGAVRGARGRVPTGRPRGGRGDPGIRTGGGILSG